MKARTMDDEGEVDAAQRQKVNSYYFSIYWHFWNVLFLLKSDQKSSHFRRSVAPN